MLQGAGGDGHKLQQPAHSWSSSAGPARAEVGQAGDGQKERGSGQKERGSGRAVDALHRCPWPWCVLQVLLRAPVGAQGTPRSSRSVLGAFFLWNTFGAV